MRLDIPRPHLGGDLGNWAMRTAMVFAAIVLAATIFWRSTVPPDPVVREGKVVSHLFEPAHDYRYSTNDYAYTQCFGSQPNQICTPIYVTHWHTGHEPDHWWITLEGCPRRAKDAATGCIKLKRREREVTRQEFDQYKIGSMMEGLT